MPPAPTNSDAHAFAADAHSGQVDKGGKPYIRHVNRVAGASATRAKHARDQDGLRIEPDEVTQAAYLHDVLEDTPITADDLRLAGFGDSVIAMVILLTKVPDELSYAERIAGLAASGDLGAILIKLSDNEDNRRADRPVPGGSRMSTRYADSMIVLRSAAEAMGYTGI